MRSNYNLLIFVNTNMTAEESENKVLCVKFTHRIYSYGSTLLCNFEEILAHLRWHRYLNKMQGSCWSLGKYTKSPELYLFSEGFMVNRDYALNSWAIDKVSGHNSVP